MYVFIRFQSLESPEICMHYLKIKDSSLHQDGKGMCCLYGLNILKMSQSTNFDNLND